MGPLPSLFARPLREPLISLLYQMAEVAKYTSKFDPDSATYGVLALLRLS
jgi:hypothetical protein